MRRRRPLLATLGLLSLCGCWFRLGNATGSMILTWTLNGGEDCATAGVTQVAVSGGGVSLVLPCTDQQEGSIAGVSLPKVAAGTQTFVLTGLGQVYDLDAGVARTQAAYEGAFVFDVAEESSNIAPVVDLPPIDRSGGGDLELLWSFAGQTCAEAEVTQITLVLDGFAQLVDGGLSASGDTITLPCHANGQDGVRLLGLPQNLYSYPLAALGPSGTPAAVYAAAPTTYVTGYTESVEHVDLHLAREEGPSLGDAIDVQLIFSFGPDAGGCAQSEVSELRLQLLHSDVSGAFVPIDGSASSIDYQTLPVLDQTIPCTAGDDPTDRPTWMTSTTDRDPGEALPCNPGDVDAGISCPIVPGEYTLDVQGLTAGGKITFDVSGYNLWVDEGLADGVPAGVVSEYGATRSFGPIPGIVNSTYEVNLPAAQ